MKEPSLVSLRNKTIVIVTQQGTTGPSHDLRDFLVPHVKRLFFVGHPLLYLPENYKKSSEWELFREGKKLADGKAVHIKGPEALLYLKDFFYTFFWFLTKIKKTDVFIGVGNINALAGVILQKIGRVEKVVFYCIDYVPVRFNNSFLNTIYHKIDKYVVRRAEVVWNVSPRMSEGRKKKWGMVLGNQITVPIGIWYDRISKNRSNTSRKNEIIYLGTLLEKQGLDLCIEAIDELKNSVADIRLTIIGSGPYEEKLHQKVSSLKLTKHVFFEGYIPSHKDVERRISKAVLALAMYNKEKDTFSYYADPGKVKVYLACGVPVLITDIPFIARQIQEQKCGFVVEYKKSDIIRVIKSYLTDRTMIQVYGKNAQKFARQFDWTTVITTALIKSSLL